MDSRSSTSNDSQDPLISPTRHNEEGLPEPVRRSSPSWSIRRRFRVIYALILLAAIGVIFAIVHLDLLNDSSPAIPPMPSERDPRWNHEAYIKGSPTGHFRENLVDGINYVTAWPIEGFTNQFISQLNLLLLASYSTRVPVLPPFIVDRRHLGPKSDKTQPLPVSEVFNLQRLAQELRKPILEWHHIKNVTLRRTDDLGCWSVFNATHANPVHFRSEEDLLLDVSLTSVPVSSKLHPKAIFLNIASLASLGWPDVRRNAVQGVPTTPSPSHKHTRLPDEKMQCFDSLYYVGTASEYEMETSWAPAWNIIGKHLQYNPRVQEFARSLIYKTFGINDSHPFPSYISIHVRHTDFASVCDSQNRNPCFPPLEVYKRHVQEVRDVISKETGIIVNNVLVASDEKNQTWWEEVRSLGWRTLNHDNATGWEIYDAWFPTIMDTVALSLAEGFIGTRGSTMSLMAARRVELWQKGPIRWVSMGSS